MTSQDIKQACDKMYAQIAYAQDRLVELREICKHENTFEGYYSYRIGQMAPAEICSDCGSLIKYL